MPCLVANKIQYYSILCTWYSTSVIASLRMMFQEGADTTHRLAASRSFVGDHCRNARRLVPFHVARDRFKQDPESTPSLMFCLPLLGFHSSHRRRCFATKPSRRWAQRKGWTPCCRSTRATPSRDSARGCKTWGRCACVCVCCVVPCRCQNGRMDNPFSVQRKKWLAMSSCPKKRACCV